MTEPPASDPAVTPGELRRTALTVAREAAALVRERRADEVTVTATKTSLVDVVTDADQASEELIRRRLAELRPADGFLGEETGHRTGSSDVVWIVDPIDGTVNYLYGLDEYAVSVAAEVAGRVVAGVVVAAASGTEYAAAAGQGATRDGVAISVRATVPLPERLVLTGFGYDAGLRARQGVAVARLLPRIRDVRRMGSAALDLCHVAEGSADGYVEEGPRPWDWAAGLLIATEAGARAELMPGASGREVVVCGPAEGFDDLLQAAGEAGFLGSEGSPGGE